MKESKLFKKFVATFVVVVLGGPAVVLAGTDAHSVGSAESAELAAAFDVRFEVEKHAWNAAALKPGRQLGQSSGEVAQDRFVSAIADVRGHEIL